MKNRKFWLGLLVMVLAFGMTLVGCDNNPSGGLFDGTWTNDDGMELVASGGTFTVKMDGTEVFRGTYTVDGNTVSVTFTEMYTDSGWTAYPENGGDGLPPKNVTGTINGNQFTIDEGGEDGGSMTFTKTKKGGGSGGSGGNNTPSGDGGTFNLSGIPNDFNNKYAVFYAYLSETTQLVGAQNVNVTMHGSDEPDMSGTAVQIKNGKVSLPMWTVMTNGTVTKYSGNDADLGGMLMIFDRASVSMDYDPIDTMYFGSITFSSGSATKTWSQGTNDYGENGGGGEHGGDTPNVDPNPLKN
jgi:hypothetical protein